MLFAGEKASIAIATYSQYLSSPSRSKVSIVCVLIKDGGVVNV